jgi:hypothetical protein
MTPYNKIPGNKVFVTCLPRLFSFGNKCINSVKPSDFIIGQAGLKVNALLSTHELIERIKKIKSEIRLCHYDRYRWDDHDDLYRIANAQYAY